MATTADWISAIAGLVSAFGIIFVAVQILLAYMQMKKDHERSRRELTIELLKDWTMNLSLSSSSARKLAETFDLKQCKTVCDHQQLELPKEKKQHILSVIQGVMGEDEALKEQNGNLVLEERHVVYIKYLLVKYLNTLETILMAWKLAIADRQILELEFSYLVKPEEGHEALAVFRQAMGGKSVYPAVHDFVATLKNTRENSGPKNRDHLA